MILKMILIKEKEEDLMILENKPNDGVALTIGTNIALVSRDFGLIMAVM